VDKNERVLITVLTKRMAEDLTDYLHEHGTRVRYLHADIETVERTEIIRDLRLGGTGPDSLPKTKVCSASHGFGIVLGHSGCIVST